MKLYLWRCKHCHTEWESKLRKGDTCDLCQQPGTRVFTAQPLASTCHPSKGRT